MFLLGTWHSKARTLFSKTLLPQPDSHHLHVFSILLLVLLCSWILLIFCSCYLPKVKTRDFSFKDSGPWITGLNHIIHFSSLGVPICTLLPPFPLRARGHRPFSWINQRSRDSRAQKTCGRRQLHGVSPNRPLIDWKSNSPFWVIALSRQQASLLAPIHKFTITLSSLWLSTLHHRVWLLSSLKNQGNFLLFSAFFHLIETAILIPMYLPHKLAQQALPIENLWPAFLLSVDTEPLSCYRQKHLHSLSVYQFYTPLPTSMWHGS